MMRNFRDFAPDERRNDITFSTGEYYPDILEDACRLYLPVLETFSGSYIVEKVLLHCL